MAFQKVCCHSDQRCTSGGVWKIIAGTSNVKMWVANWMLRINAMLKGRDRKKEGRFTKCFWSLFFSDVSGAEDRIYWNYSAVNLDNVVTEGLGAWKRVSFRSENECEVCPREFSSSSSFSRNLLLSRPSDWSKRTTTSASFPYRARAVSFRGRQFLKCAGSEP